MKIEIEYRRYCAEHSFHIG